MLNAQDRRLAASARRRIVDTLDGLAEQLATIHGRSDLNGNGIAERVETATDNAAASVDRDSAAMTDAVGRALDSARANLTEVRRSVATDAEVEQARTRLQTVLSRAVDEPTLLPKVYVDRYANDPPARLVLEEQAELLHLILRDADRVLFDSHWSQAQAQVADQRPAEEVEAAADVDAGEKLKAWAHGVTQAAQQALQAAPNDAGLATYWTGHVALSPMPQHPTDPVEAQAADDRLLADALRRERLGQRLAPTQQQRLAEARA